MNRKKKCAIYRLKSERKKIKTEKVTVFYLWKNKVYIAWVSC